MSDIYVPLTTVTEIKEHPNAERLDIAIINGWQTVVAKGSMQAGDAVIYVGIDCMVPDEWATKWGVKEYLSKGERVKAVRLRGEPSYGFALPVSKAGIGELVDGRKLDDDVSDLFGITKYIPPPPKVNLRGGASGQRMPEDPKFFQYTKIQNMRHYPHLLDGYEVVVTEKIHGTNSRVGVIDGERVAGSHRVQRRNPGEEYSEAYCREFERRERAWYDGLPRWKKWTRDLFFWPSVPFDEVKPDITYQDSIYWKPWQHDGIATMLNALGDLHDQVVLYGELYGPGIQALSYGVDQGETAYVAFDLMIDGKFLDYDQFETLCRVFGVPIAPRLYVGVVDFDKIRQMSEGPTTLNNGPHYLEGVIVRPTMESQHPTIGRLILKYVSDTYLTAKGDAAEDLSNDAAEAV